MEMNPWGASLLDIIALMNAMSNKSDSEMVSMIVVEDIVEFVFEKGDSKYVMPLDTAKLTTNNVMDVIAHMVKLARMEHAAKAYPITKRVH
tara:strand:- start:4113 stop:4385 length:273 start_codon:yes stop_codon:yes gene_type:complete